MATIQRGKRKGEEVKLHQWCNDWVTIKGSSEVFSPPSLQLRPDEIELVRASADRGDVGHMFMLYDLTDDGRFVKKARS